MKTKRQHKTCAKKITRMPPFHKKAFALTGSQEIDSQPKATEAMPIDINKMEHKELTKLADKKKWMQRFRKAYSIEVGPELDVDYAENVKFVVAISKGKQVGFLQLLDRSMHFAAYTDEPFWHICVGYVKPAYKGQRVLKAMIENAVQNYHVKSLSIDNDLLAKHFHYYLALGFTHHRNIGDTSCSRLYLTACEPVVNALLGP